MSCFERAITITCNGGRDPHSVMEALRTYGVTAGADGLAPPSLDALTADIR